MRSKATDVSIENSIDEGEQTAEERQTKGASGPALDVPDRPRRTRHTSEILPHNLEEVAAPAPRIFNLSSRRSSGPDFVGTTTSVWATGEVIGSEPGKEVAYGFHCLDFLFRYRVVVALRAK